MRGCEREASAQMVGSAIFSSMRESSRRRRGESKILPQFANSIADRGERVFKVGKHISILKHVAEVEEGRMGLNYKDGCRFLCWAAE
jgi:hypothetical protein